MYEEGNPISPSDMYRNSDIVHSVYNYSLDDHTAQLAHCDVLLDQ